jgi:hypothetical protein
MRRYDDPVEVRRGMVPTLEGSDEGPEQFLWRGRLWKVSDVLAHWVETGAWWRSAGVYAVLGAEEPQGSGAGPVASQDSPVSAGPGPLAAEREVWRVEASPGRALAGAGVFDLTFDWSDGGWRLTRCAD